MLTLGPCINNDATVWKLLVMNGKGEGYKREEHSFLAPTLIPCQSIGRRSLSTLELECLSFTHQTICFIRFIFSPSDPAQPDKALMMKHRGHPCIISELAWTKVCVYVCACVRAYVRVCARVRVFVTPQQFDFGRAPAQTVMATAHLSPATCAAPRTGVPLHFFFSLTHLSQRCLKKCNEMEQVIKSRKDFLNSYNKL